jgi:hypothetical protein
LERVREVKMKKLIVVMIIGFIIFGAAKPCFALTLNQISAFIHNPQELELWFRSEFKYVGEVPDRWQKAEETINLRQGDCEDFALLAHEVLGRLGVESRVYILKFKGLQQMHAVCVFEDKGFYSMFSNKALIATEGRTAESAIKEAFADLEYAKALVVKDGKINLPAGSYVALGVWGE